MTHRDLLDKIDDVQRELPETHCRVFPASFNPDDPTLRAFPVPVSREWMSLKRHLRHFRSRGVLLRLPLFWQVESPLYRTCREVDALYYANDVTNMPLGAAALRGMHLDTVLTDRSDAVALSTFLGKAGTKYSWVIVHSLFETPWTIPDELTSASVAQEVHMFPGVPILTQCESLIEKKVPYFHVVDTYEVEITKEAILISSPPDDPVPLVRYVLPPLSKQGSCACGKRVFSST